MLGEYTIGNLLVFFIIVFLALALDLYAHKKDKPISILNASLWSIFWVVLSLLFSFYVLEYHGKTQALLFLTGYFLEKSLSVDNLFVFIAIFASFSIKDEYQHRILYFGILGAIIMRLLFISLGSVAISLFGNITLLVFGFFVLWTAWKMWSASKGTEESETDFSEHWSVKGLQRILPIWPHTVGHNFFTRQQGKLYVTPLFLCLLAIELADVLFAVDSVPAIFSLFAGLDDPLDIGTQTFLIFTSNIFAILGLRSLYFLLVAANRFLSQLDKAIIAILTFIGLKMLAGVFFSFHISPAMNLIIVASLLLVGIVASIFFPEKNVKDS